MVFTGLGRTCSYALKKGVFFCELKKVWFQHTYNLWEGKHTLMVRVLIQEEVAVVPPPETIRLGDLVCLDWGFCVGVLRQKPIAILEAKKQMFREI